ncbi:MAG: sterol desaturase family protein [Roseivirga sp.]|nr:sterol desaturase family protein [Roseivirga sp.]
MGVAYGTLLLLVLVLMELLIVRLVMKEKIPWNEVILNLNSGHVLLWIFRGMEVLGFHYVLQYFSLDWIAVWPPAVQWVFGFVAWDFLFYWLHRLHHKWPLLWSIHAVHHQGEHFSLSLGIRNSWYSSLSSFPFFVPLAVLGLPLEIFVTVSSIHYTIQFYNHNRIVKKSGWLEYIMITPSHHRVHHGKNAEYLDKNCGGTFVFWDKLFGTFQQERDDINLELGTLDEMNSENPFWANNIPVAKFLKIPLKSLGAKTQTIRLHPFFIALGAFVLFGLLVHFIFREASMPLMEKAILFALLFFGTIANGGLMEGKVWGIFAWSFIPLALAVCYLLAAQELSILPLVLIGLLGLHCLYVLVAGVRLLMGKQQVS